MLNMARYILPVPRLFLILSNARSILIVAIIKKRLSIPESLYTILQVLSVSLFERTSFLSFILPGQYKLTGNGIPLPGVRTGERFRENQTLTEKQVF